MQLSFGPRNYKWKYHMGVSEISLSERGGLLSVAIFSILLPGK
jgi:hypothetical protein